ncbi:MAG: TetR/AcrR family transcriptional regulator [Methyloligellaceae bacterium]
MPRNAQITQDRIVAAAVDLFYGEGIRAVSVDAVAEKAGVTKRTLYYHFKSKDDLIAAALEARDQPTLALFARWLNETEGPLAKKIEGMFRNVARSAQHPKWKGCGFQRTAAELASTPGHPALRAGAAHKKRFEAWLADVIAAEGFADAALLARQIVVLLDGAVSVMLVHRDPIYVEAAGGVAAALVSRDA